MSRLLVSAAAGGLVGGSAVWLGQKLSFRLMPIGMTYDELAATLLAASAILVTIIGVFVAILALWGFAHFKSIAESAAREAAVEKVESELKSGELRTHLEEMVIAFVVKGVRNGTLRALIEERAREEGKLETLDEQWGSAEGGVNGE